MNKFTALAVGFTAFVFCLIGFDAHDNGLTLKAEFDPDKKKIAFNETDRAKIDEL